jgi:hypothetical protein
MHLKLFAIICLGVLFSECSPEPENSENDVKHNILFISIDDLRNDLGALGVDYVYTPHLDAFAEQARLFSRHYVQVPTCGASPCGFIERPARSGDRLPVKSCNSEYPSRNGGITACLPGFGNTVTRHYHLEKSPISPAG